jgi:cobalt/nickel transport protein
MSGREVARALAVLAFGCGLAVPSQGHFQLLHTAEAALNRGQPTQILLLFTHPAHGGPNMHMGEPEEFYVVSQRGEDADSLNRDLREFLEPIAWSGDDGDVQAFVAELPANVVRSLGDYVFVLRPSPYYEAGEDKYIQQLTKMMMNVGGIPGNWAEPMGLEAEILPLDKPYANWTGGVFRGVVLSEGRPVPNAEIEVEYVNYGPDTAARRFAPEPEVILPQESFGTMSIRANSAGEFTIGLPKAGWWGICALAIGPDIEHEGKLLSQDAVLWVHVRDIE